jgi:hypothetical protein
LTRLRTHLLILAAASVAFTALAQSPERRWLAGDSHIHSQWSPGYDRTKEPPEPIKGGDAIYPTPVNAKMAKRFGLSWMVTTDHGGPNHSKFNLTQAYEELKQSRQLEPDLLQFYGMELNMPGMDHHTLIVPRASAEATMLYNLENRFDANELWPPNSARNSEEARLAALKYIKTLPRLPLMFANHPSRSARALGGYGLSAPQEFRQSNDMAPEVYRGMEGAPGHQAGALAPDGSTRRDASGAPVGFRGAYANAGAHTLGGFDQMTAIVGGFWDSLLGDGRRFWIVASSDSHVHYSQSPRPGSDFWPGEFHKTYVHARKSYDDVLEGLRAGRIFAVAGDLISVLEVEASAARRRATVGATLRVTKGEPIKVTIRFRDPDVPNHHGDNPKVARVDVIIGVIRGPQPEPGLDRNDTTKVLARFDASAWKKSGEDYFIETTLPPLSQNSYIRVRGTNSADEEPAMDVPGENPWADLWFYSNPIFIEVK